MTQYNVANAQPTHVLGLHKLLEGLHRESIFADIPLSEKRLGGFLLGCIGDTNCYSVVCLTKDGTIVGTLFAERLRYFFSAEFLIQDVFVFVAPEFRKTTVFLRMFRDFMRWAKQQNVTEICFSTTSGINPEGYKKTLEKLGLHEVGTIHKLTLKGK